MRTRSITPVLALPTLCLALAACSQQDPQADLSARARSANQAKATTTLNALSGSIVVIPSLSTTNASATALANKLVGGGVTVSNATLTGAPAASGTFTGGTLAFGFSDGVILSSGAAAAIVGPNNQAGQTDAFGTPGDADLFTLAKAGATAAGSPQPTRTNDASILQFDFIPTKDTVYFNYTFASEEYLEYANTIYNDVFGFFINGTNCATVPGFTGTPPAPVPVSVNTINDTRNAALYRNNTTSGALTQETQADGLTVTLTCGAKVNPGVVNHAKLAIADSTDTILNSWVMIQAGSFSTSNANAPVLSLPADQTIEATGPGPVSVPFTVTASDVQDGDLTSSVTCNQTSPLSVAVGTTTTVNCSVTDSGGLQTTGAFSVKVQDTVKPTITITKPTATAYTLNQVVLADYSCADAVGVTTCAGPVASGTAINTSTFGPKTFTVNASDAAGNTQSASVNYTVEYPFSGFLQPVDNLPTINSVKAGQAIPVKFSLGGNYGLNIFAAGSPASIQVGCTQTGSVDAVEQTVTAGGSSLTYDPASKVYNYVWKTDKSWAGTCRRLSVRLNDGSLHEAMFMFK